MRDLRSYADIPRLLAPGELKITDCTVRDGAQMPGIVMTSEDKVRIYELLHRIGIDKIECFLHNERDRKATKEMLEMGYDKPEVTAWSRARKEDIDLVLSFDGIRETGMLMSVSDVHLFDKIRFTSREDATNSYLEAFEYAVDHGLRVRIHLEDVTRANFDDFVIPLVRETLRISKDTIYRICDTLGFGLPYESSPL
ncbi:MAG: isopropylmalate synthase, partial [Archaeoglobi archaeon]|nr:isopropylmalate synthase [Candidatus Mnemosynella sp.]